MHDEKIEHTQTMYLIIPYNDYYITLPLYKLLQVLLLIRTTSASVC